jgi:hypothetical protein
MQQLWTLPLDGQEASSELLLPEVEPGRATFRSAFAAPDDGVSPGNPGQAMPQARRTAGPAAQDLGGPAVLANTVASPEGAALAALQVLGEELLSKAHDEPWVPSLIPSTRPRGEAPCVSTPAGLTKTEMAPLYQDLDLGEDLTALSLKMRRVLDEEARRHGIDV